MSTTVIVHLAMNWSLQISKIKDSLEYNKDGGIIWSIDSLDSF